MTKHQTLMDFVGLFTGWGMVFFGLLATSPEIIPLFYKYVFALADTIAFCLLGVAYFRWAMFRQKILKVRVALVLLSFVELVEGFFAFFTVVTNWKVLAVNGVPVVTYDNLILVTFSLTGFFLVVDAGRRIRKYWR